MSNINQVTPQDLPPAIGFCVNEALFASGSEFYRVHRPANVIAKEMQVMTFVATRFTLPELDRAAQRRGDPIMMSVADEAGNDQVITPNVVILRASVVTTVREDDDYKDVDFGDAFDTLRRQIAVAQKAGQIVILDLDDHPYAWNAFQAQQGNGDRAVTDEQWQSYDAYVAQFNAVLCSTRYLQKEVMWKRWTKELLGGQRFEYAPNLYDPFRYDPSKARFGKALGCHLFAKARDQADFDVLGAFLRPVLEADPKLSFIHMGEEFPCADCSHPRLRHYEEQECDECACDQFTSNEMDAVAELAGLPYDRVISMPACSPWELHNSMLWNVGVIPLADSEWNYAKTEGKGFEMAAAGIPFVALTGEHPLYLPWWDNGAHINKLTTQEDLWNVQSKMVRQWAEGLAQEHQRDYIATMKRLGNTNLAK